MRDQQPAQTTRPAPQTTTRRKPVRATTYDARGSAMARAVEQMFTDRDLTTPPSPRSSSLSVSASDGL